MSNPAGPQQISSTINRRRATALLFGAELATKGATLAVLLHGFPDVKESFAPLAEFLQGHGYVVVVPTMRGYERETCVKCDTCFSGYRRSYLMASIADDVHEWVQHVQQKAAPSTAGQRIVVIGHDWGAIAAHQFTVKHPDVPSHVINIAVPYTKHLVAAVIRHPIQIWYSWYMLFFQLPWLPEFILRCFSLIRFLWRTWSPKSKLPPMLAKPCADSEATLREPVVTIAALGYYRSLFNFVTAFSEFKKLLFAAKPLPKGIRYLALHGDEDGCIHPAVFQECTESAATHEEWGTSAVKRVCYRGAGHWVHLERASEVHEEIISWLKKAE